MKFNGYKRSDGRVGIRNHVVVMPGVVCSAGAAQRIANKTDATYLYNPNGCGQGPSDTAISLEILSGLLANPNVYGALIVGLGCEVIQKEDYLEAIKKKADKPIFYIDIQSEGGIDKTVEKGLELVKELQDGADKCIREESDLSELILGLECGASDPTSGFSANPVLGNVSDRIIDFGGTTVLTETPEVIGAEHILRDRSINADVGERIYNKIIDYDNMFKSYGENIRATNPSPGNRASGITTLEEKSLGCITKSGTKPFIEVYDYGDVIDKKGLMFLDGTAYDVASVVALIAGGAQMVAFTTGMGTPVGNAIAPVVKITGNADTAVRLADIIDFDSSANISGEKSLEELGQELLDYIVRVCNGEEVKAEEHGFSEMAINQFHSYA